MNQPVPPASAPFRPIFKPGQRFLTSLRFLSSLRFFAALGWATALLCPPLHADSLHDGGRDLSVLLFSNHRLADVTLTPLSVDSWTATCASCAHHRLTTPQHLSGNADLFAGGALRITDNSSHEQRNAIGLWHLRSRGEGINVVLTLPSERYVAAVLNAESALDEPPESLRALAIVARTYALNGSHFTAPPGHLAADLCDSTQCQALRLAPSSPAIDDAVRATAGETLWFRGHRAQVFFSEHCGGLTEDARAVWPKLPEVPYLASHPDPYCTRRGPAAWHAEISLAEFASIAASQGWRVPGLILSARVSSRTASHRAMRIAFTGTGGVSSSEVDAEVLRLAIGRTLGWNRVRGDLYDLSVRNGSLVFDGRGYGHGIGLCQTGATEMAAEHKNAREILAFYFPGVTTGIGPDDNGWQTAHTPSVTLRSVATISPARQVEIEQLWQDALRRFPPQAPLTPKILFAPSTELFRQLTSQPGWTLASTHGSEIVLQPDSVLRRNGNDPRATFRHEMLHVLVESEASEKAPLWLREGLVAELAGETQASNATLPTGEIEAALLQPQSKPQSWDAGQRAHQAAAALVHRLVARYGISAVRGWLHSGVPAAVE